MDFKMGHYAADAMIKFAFFSAHNIEDIVLILILKYSLPQMTDIETTHDLTDNSNGIVPTSQGWHK
jgi:hypothetical protein